jgi:hypothetical protein
MSDIKIKFERDVFIKTNLPVVRVEVQNYAFKWLPMYFLIDSGANVCQLSEMALECLDLDTDDSEIPLHGISGSVDSPKEASVEVRDIETQTEFITFKFTIVPDEVFNIIQQDADIVISGILGSDFFYKNDMIIDYSNLCLLMEK